MTRFLVSLPLSILILSSVVYGQSHSKPRVFVTDSDSWQIMGGFTANKNYAQGHIAGGARPQTAEIMKTLGERCPDAIVTINKEKADYILILQHEGRKGIVRKDNKFALFNSDGDAIKSGSTRSLGNSVKDTCKAMMEDWRQNAAPARTPDRDSSPAPSPSAPGPAQRQDTDSRSTGASVGDTMHEFFDRMTASAHTNDQSPTQRSAINDEGRQEDVKSASGDHAPAASPQQSSEGMRIGQQATTEFGRLESVLLATALSDHFARVKAEKAGDLEGYEKLKKSGKLRRVANHSQVQIIGSARDQDGGGVFEVKLTSGKTVWIESKFLTQKDSGGS